MLKLVLLNLLLLIGFVSCKLSRIEDIFIPDNCEIFAKTGDHLLIEYTILSENGTAISSVLKPKPLFHIQLDTDDTVPINRGLKGMCKGSSRRIVWDKDSSEINLHPLFAQEISAKLINSDESFSIEFILNHITDINNYQIFSAFKSKNISMIMDLIDSHLGVNAVNEWGETPLMMATTRQMFPVIAHLLNTRMPAVEVNMAKSTGYTVLFYAIEHATPGILQALLRRGADPNAQILQEGSKGNTPLHFSCLFEKSTLAELLVQYGGNPLAINQHGQTPLQLLPKDVVPSTRLKFKKIFEDVANKLGGTADSRPKFRNEL